MKIVSATEVKNRLGAVLDGALVEPILVEKSGRPSVVMLSVKEYDRLTAVEDAYWAQRAVTAEAGGFASSAEVSELIERAGGA